MFGGPMPNAGWRIVEFLTTLRDSGGRVLIPGFYDRVLPKGEAERDALAELPLDLDALKRLLGVREFDLPSGASYWDRIMYEPTIDISGIAAGYGGPGVKALIPASGIAKVGFRLVADQDPLKILDLLRQHAAQQGFDDLTIEPAAIFHPLRVPFDTPLGNMVARAAGDAFGEVPLIVPINGGSNPNHIWSEIGIPPVELSYCHQGGLAHGANEHMRLDRLRKGIMASALVMTRLLETEP